MQREHTSLKYAVRHVPLQPRLPRSPGSPGLVVRWVSLETRSAHRRVEGRFGQNRQRSPTQFKPMRENMLSRSCRDKGLYVNGRLWMSLLLFIFLKDSDVESYTQVSNYYALITKSEVDHIAKSYTIASTSDHSTPSDILELRFNTLS